jgi:TatA/E family protein of Tat protein translocase
MLGTIGVQEMIIIFLVALVLFGPKKLPELGRTLGKALTEFRRHSNDLKATFEREMQNLERESAAIHASAEQTAADVFNHATYHLEHSESEPALISAASETVHNPSTVGASEVVSAESHGAAETVAPQAEHAPAIEGTVPRGPHPAPLAEIAQETSHAHTAGSQLNGHPVEAPSVTPVAQEPQHS